MQLPLVGGPHRNQQLFSDYYLNAILPQRPDWRALATEAAPTLDAIRKIYDGYTPSANEAQTERELVRCHNRSAALLAGVSAILVKSLQRGSWAACSASPS